MSGWDNPNTTRTEKAGATIRKGQFVKLSAGKVIPCSVANEAIHGVAVHGATLNQDVAVVIEGECVVEVATASMGVAGVLTPLSTDANGMAVPYVSGNKLGYILEPGIALVSGVATTRRAVIKQTI